MGSPGGGELGISENKIVSTALKVNNMEQIITTLISFLEMIAIVRQENINTKNWMVSLLM